MSLNRIDLAGDVAVVTGAGSGIGKGVALRLAREGAIVVAADISAEAAGATAAEIEAVGGSALAVRVDVRDLAQLQAMVDLAVASYGRIDILVACAGVCQAKGVLDITEEDWDRVFDVNTKGLFFTLQAVAKQMVRQKSGVVLNIASVGARGPRPALLHYAASKAAVVSLTWSAAAALAPSGIRVNALCPGTIETPMWAQLDRELSEVLGVPEGEAKQDRLRRTPLGRLETVEDVADAVVFFVSPQASYITGQSLNVDGGFEMN